MNDEAQGSERQVGQTSSPVYINTRIRKPALKYLLLKYKIECANVYFVLKRILNICFSVIGTGKETNKSIFPSSSGLYFSVDKQLDYGRG